MQSKDEKVSTEMKYKPVSTRKLVPFTSQYNAVAMMEYKNWAHDGWKGKDAVMVYWMGEVDDFAYLRIGIGGEVKPWKAQ